MTGNHRRGLTARRRAVPDRSTTSRIRNATLTLATVLTLVVGSVLMSGTAPAAQTGGSGGAFTDRTFQPFTASNGLSSQYHIYAAGLSAASPLCVVFQFHGDGAYSSSIRPRRIRSEVRRALSPCLGGTAA